MPNGFTVNAHRFDPEASSKANGLKGAIPQVMQGGLRKVFVFFSDDDPTDDNPGAVVHDLTMFADGVAVEPERVARIPNLLGKVPVTPDLTSSIVLRPNEITYLRRHRAWLKSVVEASNDPFFINLIDEIAEPVAAATASRPLRADDTDVIFYEYAVPDSVDEITFPCTDRTIVGTAGGEYLDPDLGTSLTTGQSRVVQVGINFDCGNTIIFTFTGADGEYTTEPAFVDFSD